MLLVELLSETGSLFVHLDWHVGHYAKAVLDEILSEDNFRNEIVWHYYNKLQGNVNRFASNHDVIFWWPRPRPGRWRKPTSTRRTSSCGSQLRGSTAGAGGADVVSVERFEVVVDETG